MRSVWTTLALLAISCRAPITAHQPVGPPPALKAPYAGRIVLRTPALRTQVSWMHELWQRRLLLLGVTGRVIFDDDRAVFDLYGIPPAELAAVARVLADPGGWSFDDGPPRPPEEQYRFAPTVTHWRPPSADCNCSGELRVWLSPSALCRRSTTSKGELVVPLRRGDEEIVVKGRPLYMTEVFVGSPPPFGRRWYVELDDGVCRDGSTTAHGSAVVVRIEPGTSPDAALRLALALGGGRLPDPPAIESVTPAPEAAR